MKTKLTDLVFHIQFVSYWQTNECRNPLHNAQEISAFLHKSEIKRTIAYDYDKTTETAGSIKYSTYSTDKLMRPRSLSLVNQTLRISFLVPSNKFAPQNILFSIGKFGAHRERIGILLFVVDQLISFVLVQCYSSLGLHQPFSCQILSTTYLSNKVCLLTILSIE